MDFLNCPVYCLVNQVWVERLYFFQLVYFLNLMDFDLLVCLHLSSSYQSHYFQNYLRNAHNF